MATRRQLLALPGVPRWRWAAICLTERVVIGIKAKPKITRRRGDAESAAPGFGLKSVLERLRNEYSGQIDALPTVAPAHDRIRNKVAD